MIESDLKGVLGLGVDLLVSAVLCLPVLQALGVLADAFVPPVVLRSPCVEPIFFGWVLGVSRELDGLRVGKEGSESCDKGFHLLINYTMTASLLSTEL